ncbi:MAG: universal stress protein [Thaumarchaeota archaeon]|nr:universal stress protein [Nitrososphaerota archaeon]
MSMDKTSRILVAIDGSESSMDAADYGISLAKKDNGELIIINIIHTPASAWTFYGASSFKEFIKKSKSDAEEWFDKIRKKASEDGIQVKTEAIEEIQSVPAAIVNYAQDKKVDLIVVGTRGRTGFSRLLLGSVALGVVTYATIPVMVVK